MTFAERIEGWHRLPPPKNVTEHLMVAELLGIASTRLAREIRAYWHAADPTGTPARSESATLAPRLMAERRKLTAGLVIP